MKASALQAAGKRGLAAVLAVLLLLTSCLVLLPLPALAEEDTAERHKQKIVTVVYDNSGSMTTGDADIYAHYAIQMLMGLLNPQDRLFITPMSEDGSDVTRDNIDEIIFPVDLNSPKRDDQIRDAMGRGWHDPVGGTPLTSVDAAVDYMQRELGMQPAGLTADDGEAEKDYWLMIMTDGAFESYTSSGKTYNLVDVLEESLPSYANFHAVYLGMGTAALDLSKGGANSTPALDNAANFTPYYAPQVNQLTLAMTSIANQLTGRYTAEDAIFSVTGNTLTLDLSGFDFAMRKVSVLVQDVTAKVEGVSYSNGGCTMTQICEIVSKNASKGLKNGFSSVITADTVFRGGKLTFTFDNDVTAGNVSILLEPALVLVPVLKYEQNGSYLPKPDKYADYSDAHYINNYLSPGTGITVGYEIHEEGDLNGAPIPPEAVFGEGNVKEELTYAGNSYAMGTPFDLVLGKNTLMLSVSDKEDGYKMYASVNCAVDAHPSYFRIEPTVVPSSTDPSRVTVEYRVFYNNAQLSLSELETLKAEAEANNLVAFTLTTQTLDAVPSLVMKNKNGSSDAILECAVSLKEYGRFDLTLKVVKDKYSFRKETALINYYPKDLVLVPVGSASLSMTANGLVSNTESFSFALSSDVGGTPKALAFDNPVLRYSVTSSNPDVILSTEVNGSTLTVTPTGEKETMDAYGESKRDVTVTVKVWVPDMDTVTPATCDGALEILPTEYSISAAPDAAGVNRFNLPGNQSSVWFTLYKDGTPIADREDLEKILASGEFTVTRASAPLSPVSHALSVEEKNGAYAIRCKVVDGHPGPLTFFITSMFTPSDPIGFEASYRNADVASASLAVAAALPTEYIWRIVLIAIEIYLICLAISLTKRFTCYIPRGFACSVSFGVNSGNIDFKQGCELNIVPFNMSNALGCGLFPRRLIPFIKVKQTAKIENLTFTAADNSGMPELILNEEDDLFNTSGDRICEKLRDITVKSSADDVDELLKQAYSWSPNPKKANQVNEVNTTSAWYPNNPIYSSVARRGAREDVTVYFFHED